MWSHQELPIPITKFVQFRYLVLPGTICMHLHGLAVVNLWENYFTGNHCFIAIYVSVSPMVSATRIFAVSVGGDGWRWVMVGGELVLQKCKTKCKYKVIY